MADVVLGSLADITTDRVRDAVHVAVVSVTAGETLQPGQHVGILRGRGHITVGVTTDLIGVVDPFLKALVMKGDQFWLFMYPHTVTGLRHAWTHDALPDEDVGYDDGCSGC